MLIGQVAQRSGVSVRMLRHYDKLGLVTPSHRSDAGYREYSEHDLRRLFQVESLRSLGMSLTQVGTALDDPEFDPTASLAEMITGLKRRIADERALLERLTEIGRAIDRDGPSGAELLETIALLNILRAGDSHKRHLAALRLGPAAVPAHAVPGDQLARSYLDEPDENAAGALLWALAAQSEPTPAPGSAQVIRPPGGRTEPDTGAIATLRAAADHADPGRRERAVRGLAGMGDAASTALRDFTNDADAQIAATATIALGRTGATDAVGGLVAAIALGNSDVEAAEVAAALAPDAALGLIQGRLAETDTEPAARLRLVQALGEFPLEHTRPLLERLRHDADSRVARVAEHLLREGVRDFTRPGRAPAP